MMHEYDDWDSDYDDEVSQAEWEAWYFGDHDEADCPHCDNGEIEMDGGFVTVLCHCSCHQYTR